MNEVEGWKSSSRGGLQNPWRHEGKMGKGVGVSLFQMCGSAVTSSALRMSWGMWSKVLGENGVSGMLVTPLSMGKADTISFYVVVWSASVGLISKD